MMKGASGTRRLQILGARCYFGARIMICSHLFPASQT